MLKEEFFPLMGEMKGYISTLTFAGKGIFFFLDSVIKLWSNLKQIEHWNPLLQMFLFVRTFGVWPSSFGHSAGAQNWKLHECGEDAMQGMQNSLCLKIAWKAYSQYLITGWVRRQRNRLPNGFFVEVGRYQSKQTRNESYALCCYGLCILSLKASVFSLLFFYL